LVEHLIVLTNNNDRAGWPASQPAGFLYPNYPNYQNYPPILKTQTKQQQQRNQSECIKPRTHVDMNLKGHDDGGVLIILKNLLLVVGPLLLAKILLQVRLLQVLRVWSL